MFCEIRSRDVSPLRRIEVEEAVASNPNGRMELPLAPLGCCAEVRLKLQYGGTAEGSSLSAIAIADDIEARRGSPFPGIVCEFQDAEVVERE